MTDPKHAAHVTGLGRYYTRPSTGERLISVTNVLDTLSKPALKPWAANLTADLAWEMLPVMVANARKPERREQITKQLKGHHIAVTDDASDLGTRIHKLADAHLTGKPMPDDPEDEAQLYLAQYIRFLSDFGINIERDVEMAEATVISPRRGDAGTLDIGLRIAATGIIHPGAKFTPTPDERHLWIVDIKSSRTRPANNVYESYPLQLDTYRRMEWVLLDDGTETKMPHGIMGTAVLNLRADDYAFIPLPSTHAEEMAYLGLLAAARWVKGEYRDAGKGGWKPATIDGTAKPRKPRKSTTTKGTP